MAGGGTPAGFESWVEPHLTTLTRYAARRVAPADRDDVVQESLIRAYQRWSTYDATRGTPFAWLCEIAATVFQSHPTRRPAGEMVELVDRAGSGGQSRDVDLERAVEGLGRRERLAVDLHYFVGLDLATVAEITHGAPGAVDASLRQARDRLLRLVGDDDPDPMDQRLSGVARRWQDRQPPPPEVPIERLDESLRSTLPWRRALALVAVVVLVIGGTAAVVVAAGRDRPRAPRTVETPAPAPPVEHDQKAVPYRDLEPHHPAIGHDANGELVTPYDEVSVTGHVSETVPSGDELVFDVVLESSGFLSLRPCPDYTITVGTLATTRGLNCAEVPYFASLVRSSGQVTGFRPVLPAGTPVAFRMRARVPDETGPQKVVWELDGPHPMPGFDGVVEVTPR